MNISNAIIEEISREGSNTLVTVSYVDGRTNQRIRLVVSQRTVIRNRNGIPVSPDALRVGMIINARVSDVMTRSIPPQANAFVISIVRNTESNEITVGRILDIDRENRNFTAVTGQNLSSVIRFNVPENARIFDRFGRSIRFSRLMPGRRVWVRHADFMTSSIPPQTTAFEIREL